MGSPVWQTASGPSMSAPHGLPQLIIRFIFLFPPLDLSPWQQFSQLHFISLSANLFLCPLLQSLFSPPLGVCFSMDSGCSPVSLSFSFSDSPLLLKDTLHPLPKPLSMASLLSLSSQFHNWSNQWGLDKNFCPSCYQGREGRALEGQSSSPSGVWTEVCLQ